MGAVIITGTAQHARAQAAGGQAAAQTAQPQKKVKDQGEYDIYNNVLKDAGAQAWPKLLQDLDIWAQKYADSDYKDERLYYYVQAYSGANQPGKELDIAGQLLAKDLKTVFKDPKQVLTVLYMTCVNIQKAPNPTADQTAAGDKAAHDLLDFVPVYFVAANKPAATSDADWTKTGKDLETLANGTLRIIAMRPGMELLQKYQAEKDPKYCEPAEAALTKALQQFPDGAIIAYNLGRAQLCQRQTKPEKIPVAMYEFARAAAIDASLGGSTDPKAVDNYLTTIYTNYHGADTDGLKQLKALAANSPFPPSGYKLESSTDIDKRKEEEFRAKYPQLALWLGIKSQLADTNGQRYFDEQLKGSGVPKLKGVIMDAKPACRSKELLVAVPEPGQQGTPQSVITLKLVKEEKPDALTGKPDTGTEIQWEGVPSAFTKEPFMLTMDTEKASITGLNITPCAATPVKKSVPKKSAPKK
ncbi:MAG: hypothetical protein ABSH44_13805 [Bryobacteraceae bacterium]|jgi:hypothetical protein